MDSFYRERRKKNWLGPVILIFLILSFATGAYFLLGRETVIVSPVPADPAFEVVFITPTPSLASPTSTPSATPKTNVKPTGTPKPKATAVPTKEELSPTPVSE